jgi:hypothetical protein
MERIPIWEGVAPTEAVPIEEITICDNPPSPMRPMEGITIDGTAMPRIEEFSEGLISSAGLDDSRHEPNWAGIGAADSGHDLQTGGNSVTHSVDREDGAKKWVDSSGNRRNAKATRRIDLPRTLGYRSWKPI